MATKVLLWQTIDKLGKRGDKISVSDGYARNYLFPRRLASLATEGAEREFKAAGRKAVKVEVDMKKQYSDLAKRIGEANISIEMLSNNEGILFGGVNPSAISEGLKRAGLEVNGKFILIDTPIKRLGEYQVTVRFHPEVQSKLKVTVVASRAGVVDDAPEDENIFAKGISVDEAEKGDPKMRGGRKRPKKDKGGEGAKKDGAKPAEGAAAAAAPAAPAAAAKEAPKK